MRSILIFVFLVFGLNACGKLPGFQVGQKSDYFSQTAERNKQIFDIISIHKD
jgi:hypothetical protein